YVAGSVLSVKEASNGAPVITLVTHVGPLGIMRDMPLIACHCDPAETEKIVELTHPSGMIVGIRGTCQGLSREDSNGLVILNQCNFLNTDAAKSGKSRSGSR